ncbi:MAG: HEAT repeat domain-containing protein [Planctomycetes bacterium]|nr:HEAT repeat domain-containing protein [Planctomycetota bacterium]
MNKSVQYGALLLAGCIGLQDISFAHGGTYRGPGDTVPAGGGGGGGGGSGPSTPSPSGPSSGSPSGPTSPTPAGPGASTGAPGGRPAGPTSGTTSSGPDLTGWEFWWNFNKDQYLNLKAAIYSGVVSGSDDFFLQQGDKTGAKNALKPSQGDIREKIVPGLKYALEHERQNDIVTGSLIALAKLGDAKSEDGKSEFEEIFKKWLPDGSQEIAETAAVSLGILANDSSVQVLKDLAGDSEAGRKLVGSNEVKFRTRAFSTYGLGLIGARTTSNQVRREIVDFLVEQINKPETSTRDVKVAAIIAMGLTPIDWSAGAGLDRKEGASSSRQAQIEYLRKYFDTESNHYMIRAHVPTAVARLLSKDKELPADAKQLLENTVKDLVGGIAERSKEKDEVRQSCALALGQLCDLDNDPQDKAAREALMAVEKKGQQQERYFALISLGQIGGKPGMGEGAEKNVNEIRGYLVGKLDKGVTGTRPWAALAVGVMERELTDLASTALPSNGDAKAALRNALKECSSVDIMGSYGVALGIAKDSEAIPLMREKMDKYQDNTARGYMALGLGLIGATEAKGQIQAIVKDAKYKPVLLQQAAIALGLLGDKTLVPDLVEMLRDAKSLAAQAAVASGLGFIGDSRSIDPLVEMLKNKEITGTARGFAAVALGIVADKEQFPWNSKISTNINYRANTSTLTTPEGTGLLDIL